MNTTRKPNKTRICESCGKRERHSGGFFANFPRDEERCRTWVQILGNEDLVHVPIHKLNKMRYVCGDHFEKRAFNKKGTRLKKEAFPKLLLSASPLSDQQMRGFPLRVSKKLTIERTLEPVKNDLSIGLNSTADNNKLTTDDVIETAENSNINAAENSPAEGSHDNEDGFNDNDCHDDAPQPAVPESQEVPEAIYSWQKDTDILPAVNDDDCIMGETVDLSGPDDCSMYCDDEPKTVKSRDEPIRSQPEIIKSPEHPAEYQCNECRKEIMGFRYTCVQCADWDLCGACEARTAHATHYVLRVPSPRPYNEVQAVLRAIRQQLLSENLFLNQEFTDDSLKVEVKDEPAEAPPGAPDPAPEPDPDPLEDSHSECCGDNTQTEDSSEESDVGSSPRHKPKSLRILRSDKTDKNTAILTREPVLTVQDDATVSEHIDLTETVSDNATKISTSDEPIRISTSDKPIRISRSDEPIRISTSDKPIRISTSDKPIRISTSDEPIRISTSDKPIRISTSDKPIRISTSDEPIRISSSDKPIRISTSDESITISTSDKPIRISTSDEPITISTSDKPIRISTSDEPITISTSDKPIRISTSDDPIRIPKSDEPIKISTSVKPIRISTSDKPITISTSDEPIRISTSDKPIRISTSDKPITISTSDQPIRISNSDEPIKISTSDEPIRIFTSDEPIRISTSDKPIRIFTSDEPIRISTSDEPITISTSDKPIGISTSDKPIRISTSDKPIRISTSDKPIRISTFDKPIRISKSDKPTRMIITIDKRPTKLNTSNKPATIISLGKATNKLTPVDPNIILSSEKSKIVTVNPARHSTRESLLKPLVKNSLTACANTTKVLAYNKAGIEHKKPTNLFADKNLTMLFSSKRIPISGGLTAKLPHHTPKLLTSNPNGKAITLDYLTKRASDNAGKVAEAVTPDRTVQLSDDVICIDDDDTPNTMSGEQLNTVKSHNDRLQREILECNVDTLQASDVPDRVGCLETNPALPEDETIVLRVPNDTNEVDLVRALTSKVAVRLERLQVEDFEYIPAKKRRLNVK